MSSYTLNVEPVHEPVGEAVHHYRVTVFLTENKTVVFDGSAETLTQAEALGEEQLERIIQGGPAPAHRAA